MLYIRHMVCARGIRVDWTRIREALAIAGFALLESPEHLRMAQLKQAVEALLRRADTLRYRDFIPALAREMGLDGRRLHAYFAQLPGHDSLLSYITRQRMAYAQELLTTSWLGIGRIARQLGYGQPGALFGAVPTPSMPASPPASIVPLPACKKTT